MFECPNCKKEIIQRKDLTKSSDGKEGTILKVRLLFLNDDGEAMGKCAHCNEIVNIPLKDYLISKS